MKFFKKFQNVNSKLYSWKLSKKVELVVFVRLFFMDNDFISFKSFSSINSKKFLSFEFKKKKKIKIFTYSKTVLRCSIILLKFFRKTCTLKIIVLLFALTPTKFYHLVKFLARTEWISKVSHCSGRLQRTIGFPPSTFARLQ